MPQPLVAPAPDPAAGLLVARLLPLRRPVVAQLVRVVVGVAFLALLAQLRVQIGPVPITGQTFGVLLLGAAYGATLGTATTLAYLALGAAGVGVFSGGAAGLAALAGPTGGYLLAFPLAAALVGAGARRGLDRRFASAAGLMLVATAIIYLLGVAWLSRFAPDLATALAWGLWPFLPGDAVKIVAAAAALPVAWRLTGR